MTTIRMWTRRHVVSEQDDRGEGVISVAIVVLVIAAIAALMWTGYSEMWDSVETNTRERVAEIGG